VSLPDAVVDALIAAGASAEQVGAAIKAANKAREAALAAKREAAAARQRKRRELIASRNVTLVTRDSRDVTLVTAAKVSPAPLQNNSPSSPPKGGSVSPEKFRGSRLPADWTLPAEWRAYASEKGCADPDREAEKFRDHWHAKAGKDARKADWFAAWRTWIGKAAEFAPQRLAKPATIAAPMPVGDRTAELRMRAETLKKGTPFARDAAQRYPRQDLEEMVRLQLLTVADLQRIGVTFAPRAVG
jgi:hypothetical protein